MEKNWNRLLLTTIFCITFINVFAKDRPLIITSPKNQSVVTANDIVSTPNYGINGKKLSSSRIINARPLTPSTILVQWDKPRNSNITVTGHTVYYTTEPSLQMTNWSTQKVGSNRMTTISHLQPNIAYTIIVQVFTIRGAGALSAPVQGNIKPDVPTKPTNLSVIDVTPTSVQLNWRKPSYVAEGIIGYVIYLNDTNTNKFKDHVVPNVETYTLNNLSPDTVYWVCVSAKSRKGESRLSAPIPFKINNSSASKPGELPAPENVRAFSISETSIEVWWEEIDITSSNHSLLPNDSNGFLQTLLFIPGFIYVSSDQTIYKVKDLEPFTTFKVKVSAILTDEWYRAPARLLVTTEMAAPKPMPKPKTVESEIQRKITTFLPKASEEYGPISHYYLVVVPDMSSRKTPDNYSNNELLSTNSTLFCAYITAKWMGQKIPNISLGDGKTYNGFVNKKISESNSDKLRVFIRAVVDTPDKNLYTSFPFSETLRLKTYPVANYKTSKKRGDKDTSDWPSIFIVPIVAAILKCICAGMRKELEEAVEL